MYINCIAYGLLFWYKAKKLAFFAVYEGKAVIIAIDRLKFWTNVSHWREGDCHPLSRAFLSIARFRRTRERLHNSSNIFVEHVLLVAGIQFWTRPNSRALGTAGSVISGLSINGCSPSANQFDWRPTLDWSVQTFGLRWLQWLDTFTQSHPFLLLTRELDKKRLCSQGGLKPIWKSKRRRRGGKGRPPTTPLLIQGGLLTINIWAIYPTMVTSKTCCIKNCIFTGFIISFNLCFYFIALTLYSTEISKQCIYDN